MKQGLQNITGICNDLDGVFYPFNVIPNIHLVFAEAAAKAICKLLPGAIALPEAIALAREGYTKYGDGVTGPTLLAKELGHDPHHFRTALFRDYHREAILALQHHAPHVLSDDLPLIAAFQKHQGQIKNGIATHGCATEWARPVIIAKGLTSFIQQNAIFGLADVAFTAKHESPLLVETCFDALGTPADERAYTEDTVKNLKTAKEHNPRLVTIFIHQGVPLEQLPHFIDFQFRDLVEFHDALHTARVDNRKFNPL